MRETTQDKLLTLLEETCNKIDVLGITKTSRAKIEDPTK
jgi:hypothetical protein